MNERKYMQRLRNETSRVRKCERQTETEESKLNCEDDRIQETLENAKNRNVTIKGKGK